MKVYIVTQSWADYTGVIIGVVSSMEKAKELAMKAKPTYDVSTVEVRCFELDGKCHAFSKAEREAYKFTDSYDYDETIALNVIDVDY